MLSNGHNMISEISRNIIYFVNKEEATKKIKNNKNKQNITEIDDINCIRSKFQQYFGNIVNIVNIDGDETIDFVELTVMMTTTLLSVLHVFM